MVPESCIFLFSGELPYDKWWLFWDEVFSSEEEYLQNLKGPFPLGGTHFQLEGMISLYTFLYNWVWTRYESTMKGNGELCATKTHLSRTLSLSYQKKDWQAGPHALLSFDIDYRFVTCSLHRLYCTVSVIQKRKIVGILVINPFFVMTTTKILRDTFLQHDTQM